MTHSLVLGMPYAATGAPFREYMARTRRFVPVLF